MTFAERLRALMEEHGLGPVAVARRVPCDPGYVSRVARGRQAASPKMARRLDEVLSAEGQLVALAGGRRGMPPEGLQAPLGSDEGASGAEQVRENSQMLIRLESRLGGDDVLYAAVAAFTAARDAAQHRRGGRDLLAAAGEAGEVAAWIAFDKDDLPASYRLASDALALSRGAGDADMMLFLRCHTAMLDLEARQPARALHIADAALMSGRLAPRVRAAFQIRRGRALAMLGDPARAKAALTDAHRIVMDGPSARDPWWTWWADPAEMAWQRGMAALDAGDPAAAVPALERAVELRAPARVRARFEDGALLLGAYARAGAWSEAVTLARRVTEAGHGVSSRRTRNLLRRTAAIMDREGPDDAVDAARLLVS
jgi:transcriptional regulator with XRE-family HTH domain